MPILSLLLLTPVLALVLAGTAWAHPFGPPPTASVSAEDRTVVVDWRAAADDAMAIGVHVGLLPPGTLAAYQEGPAQVAPSARDEAALSASTELRRYLLDNIVVAQNGRPCAGEVIRTEEFVQEGASVAYRCPAGIGMVELRLSMLHEVDEAYRTFALAESAVPDEAVFTTERPVQRLDFTAATTTGPPGEADGPGTGLTAGLGAFERRFLALADPTGGGLAALGGALLVAFVVGAGHALAPGHGKALAGAYLAGGRGHARDALLLGASVAAMHSASVLVLGLGIHALTRNPALGERVGPWLSLGAGLLVLAVGVGLLVRQRRGHRPDHGHRHPAPLSRRGLVLIGLSGGLLPSPSAFLVLATAVFLGRTLYGVALVVAFSLGLATTLTLVGLAVIRGRAALAVRGTHSGGRPAARLAARLVALLPLGSAVVLTAAGAWLTTVAALRL